MVLGQVWQKGMLDVWRHHDRMHHKGMHPSLELEGMERALLPSRSCLAGPCSASPWFRQRSCQRSRRGQRWHMDFSRVFVTVLLAYPFWT